jgi:hypothetical protein
MSSEFVTNNFNLIKSFYKSNLKAIRWCRKWIKCFTEYKKTSILSIRRKILLKRKMKFIENNFSKINLESHINFRDLSNTITVFYKNLNNAKQ